jgi:putative AdoMet-dependent methyltransferase
VEMGIGGRTESTSISGDSHPDSGPRVTASDPFPSSDFDAWVDTYDEDVVSYDKFPFAGYQNALDTVVHLAAPARGMSVLDIGTGTGNLAVRFADRGCELWCTDFSEPMLARARQKLPAAQFIRHDLRADWPHALNRRFDSIVSAYVFHHFELNRKTSLIRDLVLTHLSPGGKLVCADLSFPNEEAMQAFAESVGELWEEEPYWLADRALEALEHAGLIAEYFQVSGCAGVYCIEGRSTLRTQD